MDRTIELRQEEVLELMARIDEVLGKRRRYEKRTSFL